MSVRQYLLLFLTSFILNPGPAQLQSAGGLQPLVELLSSYDKEVLHNACLVINVCATDEASAVEMHRLG